MAPKCVVGSSVTANQLKDFFRQIADGSLTGEHIQAVLEHRDPFSSNIAKWYEENGVIYFSVTSDGTSGGGWIHRMLGNGFRLDYAKQLLGSSDFKPTNGVTTKLAVLKGSLFTDDKRVTSEIRAEAYKRKLEKPNAEVACLIREKFTDEEIESMGLTWLVVMHEPIKDFDGDPSVLGAARDDGGRWLYACDVRPDSRWDREDGFAFRLAS